MKNLKIASIWYKNLRSLHKRCFAVILTSFNAKFVLKFEAPKSPI